MRTMRIPHVINKNTLKAYKPDPITFTLLYEQNRKLRSEDFRRFCPRPLRFLCVETIAANFIQNPIYDKLVLCTDQDYILEILPTDLPLSLVVPIINDEIYWMRRYKEKYGVLSRHCHVGWTWKCIYLESFMQELIETAHPEFNDEERMHETTMLLMKFIHRLVITQLQSWKVESPDEINETASANHINLEPILRRLPNIVELVITFGMNDIGENFTWSAFHVTIDDAKHLAAAIVNLKKLTLLDLHSSNIGDSHMQILAHTLIKVDTLKELSLKSCAIADHGALCIAKIIMTHKSLRRLTLANNKIGGRGGEGLGYALSKEQCCPLKHLDLRLNPLGHVGVMGLFRAMVRVRNIEELIISGVGFEDETSIRLGVVLQLNSALKFLDISNNWCKPGEKAIADGMALNTTLKWFDYRETDIGEEYHYRIKQQLKNTRKKDAERKESEFYNADDEDVSYETHSLYEEYYVNNYEGLESSRELRLSSETASSSYSRFRVN